MTPPGHLACSQLDGVRSPRALLMGCNVLSWPFSFSLECVCHGQMPCIQPVWTEAGVLELLFPAVRLQISSFHCCWRLLHMRFATFQMCEVSTPCWGAPLRNHSPPRTLSWGGEQIRCVLDHCSDSDLNTDYMWVYPREVPLSSFHLLFVTPLKAVNWKKWVFFVLVNGSGISQVTVLGMIGVF